MAARNNHQASKKGQPSLGFKKERKMIEKKRIQHIDYP